ncbi:MAG: hypothetical protein AB1467_02020 [Candidatus Diapherotrites archaeon]
MDYWNSLLTEKSWLVLQELKDKFDFLLIGGWAVFLWVNAHKSKDIDLVVEIEELQKIKGLYELKKNDRLRKYEFFVEEIDVDVYLPFYSKLALPVEELKKFTAKIQGFKVVRPEILLILKQGAEIERMHSEKGLKDRIDLMDLMLSGQIDFKKYSELLEKYSLVEYKKRLIEIVNGFRELNYLNLNVREFKKKKLELLEKIKG